MRKLLTIFLATALIAACNAGYGDKHMVNDKSEVYYKGDGVTAEDAKKLGDFLLQNNYFDTISQKSVQLTRTADTFNVKFVVDKTKVDQTENAEMLFTIMGSAISTEVFAGKPVKVILADAKMEGFKEIPIGSQTAAPATEDSVITIAPEDSVQRD